MDNHIDLIGKKLTDSLTVQEAEAFERLMQEADFNLLFKKYERIWFGSRERLNVMNSQTVLNKTLLKILSSTNDQQSGKKSRSNQHDWNWALKFAASLLIIISISFSLYWYLITHNAGEPPINTVEIIKENPRGQKSTIFLPDGSKVILNSESSISYPSVFTQGSREIVLDGEAFFEVEPNKDQPFIVKTDVMDIRVLGTSFNVNAYNSKEIRKVSLATGEVVITQTTTDTNTNNKVILSPGEAIYYDKSHSTFSSVGEFNPKAEYGWKDGLIYFGRASFKEVIQKLESWYGVDFIISGRPDSEWHYSGEFDNYALNNVLNALGYTGKFSYGIEGKIVYVNFFNQ